MELYIDEKRIESSPPPGATVDDVLENIRRDNATSGHVIVGLVCDGVDVFGPELTSVLPRRSSECRRIDVQTGAPQPIVADALASALNALSDIDDMQVKIVALFGEGKTAAAMTLLSECIGEWLQINNAITQSLALLSEGGQLSKDRSDRLAVMIKPVYNKLTEIKNAVTAQDFVAVADILEYEFSAVGDCWRTTIESVLEHPGGVHFAADPN